MHEWLFIVYFVSIHLFMHSPHMDSYPILNNRQHGSPTDYRNVGAMLWSTYAYHWNKWVHPGRRVRVLGVILTRGAKSK